MQNLKIYRGQPVVATDGEVGRVEYVIIDPQTHEVSSLVVHRGDKEWLVPTSRVTSVGDDVRVAGSRTELEAGPRFQRESYREVDEDEAAEGSQRRAERGGAPLLDAEADAVVVRTEPARASAGAVPAAGAGLAPPALQPDQIEREIELREERLVVHKEPEQAEIRVRIETEEVAGRLEVEALREEVEVEHIPVGQVVNERVAPWEEDGALVVPVYEEQLVVVKRLFLREHLRIRRLATTETHLFEDALRRERLRLEDPANTGLVREVFPAGRNDEGDGLKSDERAPEEGGILERVVRKAFQ